MKQVARRICVPTQAYMTLQNNAWCVVSTWCTHIHHMLVVTTVSSCTSVGSQIISHQLSQETNYQCACREMDEASLYRELRETRQTHLKRMSLKSQNE